MTDKKISGSLNVSGNIKNSNIYISGEVYGSTGNIYNLKHWNSTGGNLFYTQSSLSIPNLNTSNLTVSTLNANDIIATRATIVEINVTSGNTIFSNAYTGSNLSIINATIGEMKSDLCDGATLNIQNITASHLNLITVSSASMYSTDYVGTTLNVTAISFGNLRTNNVNLGTGDIILNNITSTNLITNTMTLGTLNLSTGLTVSNLYLNNNFYKNNTLFLIKKWDINNNNNDLYYTRGNVGINTSTPMFQLDVNGTLVSNNMITNQVLSKVDNTAIYIIPDKVGIDTTSPVYKLHVNGGVYATGQINVASDIQLKTEIVPIEDPINKINKLNGVYYKHRSEKNKNIGFIAQDVERVLPEVVANKDTYKSIKYDNITVLLIEALKQLSERVKILKQLK